MLGALLFLAGLLLIAYGANALPLAVLLPNEFTKDGVTVKWSRAGDYQVRLIIIVSANGTVYTSPIHYPLQILVYREAAFKKQSSEGEWIYDTRLAGIYGRNGGSCVIYPVNLTSTHRFYAYTVNFAKSASPYPPGFITAWEFVGWLNKGVIMFDVGTPPKLVKIRLDFELPIPSQVPSTTLQPPTDSPGEDLPPQETQPTEAPDVVVSSTSQGKTLNYGYIFLGAVVCLAGAWTATKKRLTLK
jgi:hypothetical protein